MIVLQIGLGLVMATCGAAAAAQFAKRPNWQRASAAIVLLLGGAMFFAKAAGM